MCDVCKTSAKRLQNVCSVACSEQFPQHFKPKPATRDGSGLSAAGPVSQTSTLSLMDELLHQEPEGLLEQI